MSLNRPTEPWHPEVKTELLTLYAQLDAKRIAQPLEQIIKQLQRSDFWRAYEAAKKLLSLYHWSGALHYCAGYAAYHIGEFSLSMSHYARVLERDRLGSLAAQEMMTQLYQQQNYVTLLMFAHTRIVMIEEPETYYMLGLAHQTSGQLSSAQRAFQLALNHSYLGACDHITYRLALAGCLYLQASFEEALTLLNSADRSEHHSPMLWLLIARCQFKLNQRIHGEISLKRALKLAPHNAQVQITCGDVLRRYNPAQALKHYRKVLSRYEAPAEVYRRVADLYEQLHDFKSALRYLKLYRNLLEYHDVASVDQRINRLLSLSKKRRTSKFYQWFQSKDKR